MDAVHSVGVHVVRKTTAATDTADEDSFFSWHSKIRKYLLHLRENGVVAASGAPAYILIRSEIRGL